MHNFPSRQPDQAVDLERLLETRSSRRSWRRWAWVAGILLLLALAGSLFLHSEEHVAAVRYKTDPVQRGRLVVTVSATGNLQPTNQLTVGSELSGIIDQVYVDVNDRVTKGQVLATLDTAKLTDAVAKSRANLAEAEAKVLQAQATVVEKSATLRRYQQVSKLTNGGSPSQNDIDVAEADKKRADADVAAARASVSQAKAELQSNETELAKASIRSPISGVVLTRDMEPGQTVAASFQTPELFTLAEDLAKMELQVDVDEADVGQVQDGQNATFTVDAWPSRKYAASIIRVSYGSETNDEVVTYPTLLTVDNTDLSLRPGMTATAEITTLTRDNALLVPNAALRFSPPETTGAKDASGGSLVSRLMPRPPEPVRKVQNTNNGAPRVWVLRDGQLVPVEVQTGASNGRVTEILGGSIEEGMQVITEALDRAS